MPVRSVHIAAHRIFHAAAVHIAAHRIVHMAAIDIAAHRIVHVAAVCFHVIIHVIMHAISQNPVAVYRILCKQIAGEKGDY